MMSVRPLGASAGQRIPIRYVVGPGYVTEQRMCVSLPYAEYPRYATTVKDDEPNKPWGSADIERYRQAMRGRLERWERLGLYVVSTRWKFG
jgi:hypothetical protein